MNTRNMVNHSNYSDLFDIIYLWYFKSGKINNKYCIYSCSSLSRRYCQYHPRERAPSTIGIFLEMVLYYISI